MARRPWGASSDASVTTAAALMGCRYGQGPTSGKALSMRGFQSKASEVRRVLERLSDAGIVERVCLAPVDKEAKLQAGNVVKLDRKVVVIVTVAGRSPEERYREIQRLVEEAGVTGVDLRFEHSGV